MGAAMLVENDGRTRTGGGQDQIRHAHRGGAEQIRYCTRGGAATAPSAPGQERNQPPPAPWKTETSLIRTMEDRNQPPSAPGRTGTSPPSRTRSDRALPPSRTRTTGEDPNPHPDH